MVMTIPSKRKRESLKELLQQNERLLEWALQELYDRQTYEEQIQDTSHQRNKTGFTKADAQCLSVLARRIARQSQLYGSDLVLARHRIQKYVGQVVHLLESASGNVRIRGSKEGQDVPFRRTSMLIIGNVIGTTDRATFLSIPAENIDLWVPHRALFAQLNWERTYLWVDPQFIQRLLLMPYRLEVFV